MNHTLPEPAGSQPSRKTCRTGAGFPRAIWRRHPGFECQAGEPGRTATENGPSRSFRALVLAASLACFGTAASPAANLAAPPGHDYNPPEPGSYALPPIKQAADGEVLDPRGRVLHLKDITRGRVTVMSFIYTRCADAKACPYATGVLMQLHRLSAEDPVLAKNMRLISMSFDPETDTPERMAAYAALAGRRKPASEWYFVTAASQEKLRPILEAYGQAVDRKANPNDPTGPLNHTLRVFLIDREGRIRNIYSSGTLDPRLVLADIRTLLLEEKQTHNTGT